MTEKERKVWMPFGWDAYRIELAFYGVLLVGIPVTVASTLLVVTDGTTLGSVLYWLLWIFLLCLLLVTVFRTTKQVKLSGGLAIYWLETRFSMDPRFESNVVWNSLLLGFVVSIAALGSADNFVDYNFGPLGAAVAILALAMFSNVWGPPHVLFLGASTPQSVETFKAVSKTVTPIRCVHLLSHEAKGALGGLSFFPVLSHRTVMSEWEGAVGALLATAKLVVVFLDEETEPVRWELQQISETDCLYKTIFALDGDQPDYFDDLIASQPGSEEVPPFVLPSSYWLPEYARRYTNSRDTLPTRSNPVQMFGSKLERG